MSPKDLLTFCSIMSGEGTKAGEFRDLKIFFEKREHNGQLSVTERKK